MNRTELSRRKDESGSRLIWMNALARIRYFIFGREADKSFLFRAFLYLILLDIAFIYVNPMIYMVSTMLKNTSDLLDPAVIWLPRTLYLGVIQEAWHKLNYSRAFAISSLLSLSVSLLQTFSCAVAGYAFAKLIFPFKRTMLFCLLLSFIVPTQVVILPNLIMAREFGLMQTLYPILLPALFGHGLKGALFVIIFRQFFSTQPKELEEAARIDGASVFKIFFRVMLPLAQPAMLVVFLFSFVWTWNDYYYPSMYMAGSEHVPLSMGISQISLAIAQNNAEFGPSVFDEPLKMASSFLIIMPPLLLYMAAQRWFVEGVERTGLVE